MIHSLQISRFGGPEVLKWIEEPSPVLKPGSVRIQVTAAGVNFADLMMRMGLYPEAPHPPFTPGYEVAGVVTEVGSLVKGFHHGDRVLAGTRFGGYSTEVVVPEYQVRKIPNKMSDTEAAGIPVNFLTASILLEDLARIRKGDKVLIPSAAGGVGTAAVQIAVQNGAQVVGVVGSKSKIASVKDLGAHEVLTTEEWEEESDDLSDEKRFGFQIILDAKGGSSLKRGFERLAPTGRILSYGVSQLVTGQKRSLSRMASVLLQTTFFTPFRLMMQNKGVFGFNALQLFGNPNSKQYVILNQALDRLMKNFEEGKYKVIIGKTFPMPQGGDAQSYLQSGTNIGKVVLTTRNSG